MSQLPAYLLDIQREIEGHGRGYGLDFWETSFEILDYRKMQEVAAFGGFPVRYPHWRFGMDYERLMKTHTYGMGKIYELVINNDPCYAYLLRSNSRTEHKLVMAHVYGHNDFFKNNYWFSKTNRKMMDEMANHGTHIRRHYDSFGHTPVENFIDACLTLEDLIDPNAPFRERRAGPRSVIEEAPSETQKVPKMKAKAHMQGFINPPAFVKQQLEKMREDVKKKKCVPEEPEKDVLKFLIEFAPLEPWQRDILTIIRDEAYYFVPQRQTKIMNEGWASYWHSRMMTHDLLTNAEFIDYADVHSSTMGSQPGVINPYKLGVELYRHIEDRWNKGRYGSDYHNCADLIKKRNWDKRLGEGREKVFEVRRIYNDITFVDEFIDAEFAEAQKLFVYGFNRRTNEYVIVDRDYTKVKEKLLFSLTNFGLPYIYVTDANFNNRNELLLQHQYTGFDLQMDWAKDTMRNLHTLWTRPVHLETQVEGNRKRFSYDGKEYHEEFLRGEE